MHIVNSDFYLKPEYDTPFLIMHDCIYSIPVLLQSGYDLHQLFGRGRDLEDNGRGLVKEDPLQVIQS